MNGRRAKTVGLLMIPASLFAAGLTLSVVAGPAKAPTADAGDADTAVKVALVAACPTFHERLRETAVDGIEIVETRTTAESLEILRKGEVDHVLAGRVLKPGEPALPGVFLSSGGYSFLGTEQETVRSEDLRSAVIFTDSDTDALRLAFGAENVTVVDDVYGYLDEGIVVTSWENTDYGRAEPVHVIEKDGSRNRLSRTPILYCRETCDSRIMDGLKKLAW